MLNGFWSSRYLEGKLSNSRTCAISPPLCCFSLPRSLPIAVSSRSQRFVSSGGSSCSFCIVISLIVIIRASYLQPWHPPPHEAIWAKREEAEETYRLLWINFFDFCVQWCGNYGHMCFTASHGCTASLCLIIFLIRTLAGSGLWQIMYVPCQVSMIYACKSNIAPLHICNWISLSSFVLQKEQCHLRRRR